MGTGRRGFHFSNYWEPISLKVYPGLSTLLWLWAWHNTNYTNRCSGKLVWKKNCWCPSTTLLLRACWRTVSQWGSSVAQQKTGVLFRKSLTPHRKLLSVTCPSWKFYPVPVTSAEPKTFWRTFCIWNTTCLTSCPLAGGTIKAQTYRLIFFPRVINVLNSHKHEFALTPCLLRCLCYKGNMYQYPFLFLSIPDLQLLS